MAVRSRSRILLAGALGGAVGSLAMKAVVRFCYPEAFGLSAATDAKAARAVLGQQLNQERAEQVGALGHYAFGIVTGAGYAVCALRYPALAIGRGSVFGGCLWLLGDELVVSAARLENPGAANASSHVSALAAHLLYGMVVDVFVSKRS